MAKDSPPNPPLRRLPWSNPEFAQAVARLVIVGLAIAYAFSDICLRYTDSYRDVVMARWVSLLAGAAATGILAWTLHSPAASVARRICGISHDTLAISLALFFGNDANAALGVVYLLMIVGNGFRYGTPYLVYATLCSMIGFGVVYENSPYWQSNGTLSFYIAAALVVVPAYMFSLLNALHKARAELEQRVNLDHLTGLINRAGMEQRIRDTIAESPRGHALFYMDLDRFKHVNDNAGHAAGDHLLKEVAGIIVQNVRADDLCARLGGDEFCVLLVDCDMQTAARIAERIRDQVQKFRLLWGGRAYSVGTSIGVAASDSVADGQSLLRLADAACYAAKNKGRNSVHVVGPHQHVSDTGLLRGLSAAE